MDSIPGFGAPDGGTAAPTASAALGGGGAAVAGAASSSLLGPPPPPSQSIAAKAAVAATAGATLPAAFPKKPVAVKWLKHTRTALLDLARSEQANGAAAATEHFRFSDLAVPGWTHARGSAQPRLEEHPGCARRRPRLLALDCEMVEGLEGMMLARVTLVSEAGTALLDEVIKHDAPVLNYLTQYSGMTKQIMDRATCTMESVLQRVIDHVDGVSDDGLLLHPAILVGHSLESDLLAMGLCHTRVIDTSTLYQHPAGLPLRHSLRNLAKMHLGRQIQAGHGGLGHSSEEDAVAALHLVQLAIYGTVDPDFDSLLKVEDEPAEAGAEGTGVTSSSLGLFYNYFGCPGRSHMIPVNPWQTAVGSPSAQQIMNASKGVASTVASLFASEAGKAPEAATAALEPGTVSSSLLGNPSLLPAVTNSSRSVADFVQRHQQLGHGNPNGRPNANSGGRFGRRGPSIFRIPAMSQTDVCSGITVIGSPSFVNSNVCGRASGIVCSSGPTVSESQRVLSRSADELKRMHLGRIALQQRWSGIGMVVSEITLPTASSKPGLDGGQLQASAPCPETEAEAVVKWDTLSRLLNDFSASVPKNTAILVVTQGDLSVAIEDPREGLANEAIFGMAFLHVAQGSAALRQTGAANEHK